MLNIELIRFEAQDVITASGVATKWNGVHESYCIGEHPKQGWNYVCNCGCHDDD